MLAEHFFCFLILVYVKLPIILYAFDWKQSFNVRLFVMEMAAYYAERNISIAYLMFKALNNVAYRFLSFKILDAGKEDYSSLSAVFLDYKPL